MKEKKQEKYRKGFTKQDDQNIQIWQKLLS